MGAAIAVVGVLAGAIGQCVTAGIQRRHEKRMKLEELKREVYTNAIVAIQEIARVSREQDRIDKEIVAIREGPPDQVKLARATERLNEMRPRVVELFVKLTEVATTLDLCAPNAVKNKMDAVMAKAMAAGSVDQALVNALINECRRDLGTKD